MKTKLARIILGVLSLALLWMYVTHYEQRTTALAAPGGSGAVAIVALDDGAAFYVERAGRSLRGWRVDGGAEQTCPLNTDSTEVLISANGSVLWIAVGDEVCRFDLGATTHDTFLPQVTR